MTPQYKAFHISLLFHLILATAFLCGRQMLGEQTPPLVIDFSLTLSEAIAGEPDQHLGLPAASDKATTPPTQAAVPPPEQIQQPVPQPVKVVRKTLQSKAKPRPQTKKERQVPPPLAETSTEPAHLTSADPTQGVSAAAAASSTAAATSTASTGSPMSTNTAISGGGIKGGGNRGNGDGMHYDFSYVRHLILKNLHFPATARKMGLTGKIVVSFVLKADGQVEGITVVASSGHDILDDTVVATIRRVAPFPKPPVSAQLKLPIVFNLK